ncbi:MAG: NADP oxidoreductase [Lentisphaerae bacterium RIFOXYC12_FULL_60_16]|nr:MAG: NADP oxidoreductase [Lentisphaerae bacterium RIFOXYC12_FULL_60_16]OGV79348.1 MAG: NADP oxidoreductase [Lentisphaerae bacterium RIFOXYB12_FULL_60_10]
MSTTIKMTIDGKEIQAHPDQTILQAADAAGVYIPRLCNMKELIPHGSCRVCTVRCNGRPQAACIQPVADGMVVESNTPELTEHRRAIIDMLFVEGNHYCMFCEKSGNCELQAMAYRLGIATPRYPYQFPHRQVDATHPDVLIDRNRCILCGRCVSASRDVDGKSVFEFVGRNSHKRVAVNAESGLGATALTGADRAAGVCPVGSIIRKRTAYAQPIGQRKYDHQPIGSDIEAAGQK